MYIGCKLYVDDTLIINSSVVSLKSMLDECCDVADSLSLMFNLSKSHCIIIGKMYNVKIAPMYLCGKSVEWTDAISYVGVYLTSAKSVKYIGPAQPATCNSI